MPVPDPTRIEEIQESDFPTPEELLHRVVEVLNGLIYGRGNSHYFVELRNGEFTTEILIPGIRPGAAVSITPNNSLAASTTEVWAEAVIDKVILHHAAIPSGRVFACKTDG